jgi:hypothetical protein
MCEGLIGNLRMAERVAEGGSAVTVIPAKPPSTRKIFFSQGGRGWPVEVGPGAALMVASPARRSLASQAGHWGARRRGFRGCYAVEAFLVR